MTELQHLIKPDGSNLDEVERLLFGAAAVRDDKLAALARREAETADRRNQANRRILEGLRAEQDALAMTDRQRFVSQASRRLSAEATKEQIAEAARLAGVLYDERKAEAARDQARETVAGLEAELAALTQTDRQRFISVALRRLSAEATITERQEVERLAGALYDEQQAMNARNEARREGEALTERLRTAQEAYADEMARLRELRDLEEGGIDQETFGRASEEAYGRMLRSSREWSDGVRRAIRDYLDDATDAAKTFEQATTRALQASEDAFVEWAMTGKFSAKDLFESIAEEALRAAYRMAVVKPLNDIFGTIFSAIGGSIFGGGIGTTSSGTPMIGDFRRRRERPCSPMAAASSAAMPCPRARCPPPCSTPRPVITAAASSPARCRSWPGAAKGCSRPGRCEAWRRSRTPSPWSMSRSTSATPRPAPGLPPMCGASRAAISPSTS